MHSLERAASEDDEPLLVVRDVSLAFVERRGESVRAVRDISLDVERGECFGIVGESGSGKTTLARCILRLERVDSGTIRFRGEDWLGLKPPQLRARRRYMQAVFQDPAASLNPLLMAGAIVAEPLRIHGIGCRRERRGRVEELLQAVGLQAADYFKRPQEFSGGQRQRVAIARAIACEPELLIADEPTSAVDLSGQAQILDLLASFNRERNLAILLISHSLPVIRRMCRRMAVVWRGQVVEMGPASAIFSSPRHPYTQALLEVSPLEIGGRRLDSPPRIHPPAEPGTLREIAPGHWAREQ
ncbi:MAG TPA: ABC transporter ATP-binding protein [Acidobacteriota bacterium]|nr:ABC transporter ATP-binding protein [Acidobacteriota bacterium]